MNKKEPIAIIGIGCRFPGNASNPINFWQLLCHGFDAITNVPHDRWDIRRFYDSDPNMPGKMNTKRGGFLEEKWEEFDADFFHFSPREANFLDPQQRLLLEMTWEAMEDAGLVPDSIRGVNAGVFIGAFTTDWQTLQNSPFNRYHCEMYSGINGSKTILSARLSHFFDLKGPCLSIDTACSSSLVAIHLACQSLWNKESSLALAGGINAILVPETSIAMSKGRFLNPSGQCRSFDADAKGYVRGEGGGIIILKPLSEAIQDGNQIYALIRGTGVNQDGYTQGGITQPNSDSQHKLMEKVLVENHINPSMISYVEAHGTGTPIGDPTEVSAISKVLGKRKDTHCYLGSVKSNIGHLEAAAGAAGLIKTVLCLKYRKIPPNLHFKNPNPNISFDQNCLKVPTELTDFTNKENSLFALVNSFGYGGTNATAVLESYENYKDSPQTSQEDFILPFSAQSPESLKAMISSFGDYLQKHNDLKLTDIAHTLSHHRKLFDYRISIPAKSSEELLTKLQLISQGNIPEGCVEGKRVTNQDSLCFVYSGMGPQWWGMARDLIENVPSFLATLQKCDEILNSYAGWSLLDELSKTESTSLMDRPEISQVANYAIQASLTEMLKMWGIKPNYIIGHSIGEVAAAYAAGALSLEDGLKVSVHRSLIQSKCKDMGTMLATGLSLNDAHLLLKDYEHVSIAAENSHRAITLSGNKEQLESIAEILEKKGIFNRFLRVNIAYHSSQMDGLKEDVLKALSFLHSCKPQIPFFSTALGYQYEECLDAGYWWQNIRNTVLFAQPLNLLLDQGCKSFIEIGPHPTLGPYIKESMQDRQMNGIILSTLNRRKLDRISLQECLGGLYVNGYPLSWDKINGVGKFVKIPTYQWRRQSHWVESEVSRHYRLGTHLYPFLSRKVESALPIWQIEINKYYFPWLEDHKIEGNIVFPAAGYVEAALEIHSKLSGNESCTLEEVSFNQFLVKQPQKEPLLQISYNPEDKTFKIHSLVDTQEKDWVCHASGKCYAQKVTSYQLPLETIKSESESVDQSIIYSSLAGKGLEYGPQFRGIKQLWRKENQALSEIHFLNEKGYLLHPTLLDAAFQTLIGTIDQDDIFNGVIIPTQIDQVIFHHPHQGIAYCQALLIKQNDKQVEGDLNICDESGNVFVQIRGLKCSILSANSENAIEKLLYHAEWIEKPLEHKTFEKGKWLVGSDSTTIAQKLGKDLNGTLFDLPKLQSEEDCQEIIKSLMEEKHFNVLIAYLCDPPIDQISQSEIQKVSGCINLLKSIEKLKSDQSIHLWIVTKGTTGALTHTTNLNGSSLWGLGRVIRQEMPHLGCTLIDLEDNFDPNVLLQELSCRNELEISYRQGKRYVYKVAKLNLDQSDQLIPLSSPMEAFALDLKKPGSIDSLFLRQIEKKKPLPTEVGIEVDSSSLNFKDLMKILGMLNHDALKGTYFGSHFGMECAGTIVALGNRVKNYKIGEKVCAFIPNSFQSYVNVSTKAISPIPPECTLENASIYIPYITVLYALKQIGKLRKEETILIHSATGAVGLAAIQYAQHIGAKIFATVGSPEKKSYLNELGIKECSDSRSLNFVNDILNWTDGKGVDVVLNSLAGDALTKSFALLAPYGRFLEIGKRDISLNSKLPMKDFDRNTLFASIDMDRTFMDHPSVIKSLLRQTNRLFRKGVFKPLPCITFPANQAKEAFQYMARSKHVGKIMLKFGNQTVSGIGMEQNKIVDSEASYLISGGLSGFGLMTARWLVEKGAKNLILLGRSGASSKEAQDTIQQLSKKGSHIKVASVDVSDREQLSNLIKDDHKKFPPIKGVIHSAMVLQDAFILQQNAQSIEKVLMPKIQGCINLHELTENLDFFVMFSSIASIVGNPGQSNYAAANSFLDAFCYYRNTLKLPAVTINWGALKTGVLSRNETMANHLVRHGINGIPVSIALKVLEKAILSKNQQIFAFDINWKQLMDSLPEMYKSFTFSDFKMDCAKAGLSDFADKLSKLDKEKSIQVIVSKMKELVGKTLKMETDKVDPTVRLNTLGIDSLLSMELLASIDSELGIKITTMELMVGPTITQLANVIYTQIKAGKR